MVYTHGWQETPEFESNQLVIGSYLKRGGFNTLFLNWEDMAAPFYPIAMGNVPTVSNICLTYFTSLLLYNEVLVMKY